MKHLEGKKRLLLGLSLCLLTWISYPGEFITAHWTPNPTNDLVIGYNIQLWDPYGNTIITNYDAGPGTNLVLAYTGEGEVTNGPPGARTVILPWTYPKRPAHMHFTATAYNAWASSVYSNPAKLTNDISRVTFGIVSRGDETVSLGFTNLPARARVDTSEDLEQWKPVLIISHNETNMPHSITWIEDTTNQTAQFWRLVDITVKAPTP